MLSPSRTPGNWIRPAAGRADRHRIARRLDCAPRLGEISAPVLVLCGRQDPQYPPACSDELTAGIGHAALVYFERSGHYPFIEEPEAFWATVDAFLTASRHLADDRGHSHLATAPRRWPRAPSDAGTSGQPGRPHAAAYPMPAWVTAGL